MLPRFMTLVYQSIRGIFKAFLPTSCPLATTSSRQAPKEGLLKKIGQTPVRLLHHKMTKSKRHLPRIAKQSKIDGQA